MMLTEEAKPYFKHTFSVAMEDFWRTEKSKRAVLLQLLSFLQRKLLHLRNLLTCLTNWAAGSKILCF